MDIVADADAAHEGDVAADHHIPAQADVGGKETTGAQDGVCPLRPQGGPGEVLAGQGQFHVRLIGDQGNGPRRQQRDHPLFHQHGRRLGGFQLPGVFGVVEETEFIAPGIGQGIDSPDLRAIAGTIDTDLFRQLAQFHPASLPSSEAAI